MADNKMSPSPHTQPCLPLATAYILQLIYLFNGTLDEIKLYKLINEFVAAKTTWWPNSCDVLYFY